jgi:regulator of protease activity HflC (stomatin/prohibitin superfamily)
MRWQSGCGDDGDRGTVGTVSTALIVALIVVVVALVLAASAIRIVREHERAVVFRPGRLRGAGGPGLVLIVPLIERTRGVNLQVDTADIHVNAVEHAIEEATH